MPTFTPPLAEGPAPVGGEHHPLWPHYGNHQVGVTVWRDPSGTYHQQQFPYQGGAEYRTFNNGILISSTIDDPAKSLANATEVYLGGSVYEVSDAQADILRAAGFFVGGHWEEEEQRWIDFALNAVPNKEYLGGDALASLDRGAGVTLWTFSDNLIGTLQPNGLYDVAAPTPNAFFTRTADVLTQLFPSAVPPAWPNPNGSNKWWPVDFINDGAGTSGGVIVLTTEVTGIITLLRNELLVLGGFGNVDHSVELEVPNGDFFVQAIFKEDAANFHYILGQAPGQYYQTALYFSATKNKIARVPIGQLETVANWQYWDGATWQSDQTKAATLLDTDNIPIEGLSDLTKVGSNYILVNMRARSPHINCYQSTNPQGPWKLYYNANIYEQPQFGAYPPEGSSFIYYLPKFHEHMNPDANHLVVSFSRNPVGTPAIPINQIHVSTFGPLFIHVPPPS